MCIVDATAEYAKKPPSPHYAAIPAHVAVEAIDDLGFNYPPFPEVPT